MNQTRLGLKTVIYWNAIVVVLAIAVLATYIYATGSSIAGVDAETLAQMSSPDADWPATMAAKVSFDDEAASIWPDALVRFFEGAE